jgi:bifunctional N-acetylglucosamine-1-phosphate-uridyltransferase/glucosamine-1-phosphate-acetyltransferase GlmU-like protein
MVIYCAHRINSINELKTIPEYYGIELDLRDKEGYIYISHDPFSDGDNFEEYLKYYNHRFLILNVKSEGIEFKILELLEKYGINNYFFLDSSFPMIIKLIKKNKSNIAIRFSEYESIETVLKLAGKVKWVWIDCFTKIPIDYDMYRLFKKNGFKLCFVSPELQLQADKLDEYKEYFNKNNINLDMVCTKIHNILRWTESNVQIIIPMSGMGKRFIEADYIDPKPLIKVDNKCIIEHVANLFPNESNITFICNNKHLDETDMYNILKDICPTCNIVKVDVNDRSGPVHAVSKIFDKIDDNKETIISYCDYGTYWDYYKFLKDTRSRNADGAIACYKGFHPHMLGSDNYAFVKQSHRWMEKIKEKESFTNDKMNEYASNGTYYFKSGSIVKNYFRQLIDEKISVNGEYYVSLVYNLMKKDDLRINIFEIENMLQWGTPYDLECYKYWSNYFIDINKFQSKFVDKYGTTLILPMAGYGSRFTAKKYTSPKPMLNVNGNPMIIEAVKSIPECTNHIFISLAEHNVIHLIKKYYSNANILEINEVTNGQATTCKLGIDHFNIDLDKPILISACDNGVYYDVEKYQMLVDDINNDIIVWSFRNNPTSKNNPNMYAWLDVDENDTILNVSCKKFTGGNPLKKHAIIGTMFFRKAKYFIDGLLKNYEGKITTNGEYYVDDVLNQNIKMGLKVKVFEVKYYICWGTPDDYETYLYWQTFFNKCIWHPYFM